ncbi:hypothetical protein OAO51_06095 [Nitrosomonadaceae bacterium]|nr:hypothetical protein [Nitrosomonadaceae bacterium]
MAELEKLDVSDNTNFDEIGRSFSTEMFALATDFYEINVDKGKAWHKEFQDLDDSSHIDHQKRKRLYNDSLKHSQFRIAMFNYMHSIFERHVNELLKLSIKKDKIVRGRYIHKFIEIDNDRVRNNQVFIRNAKFDAMEDNEKNEIYLQHLKAVTETIPPLFNWQYFYDISDKHMFRDENLKFDYNEIRNRRNLLTHRGDIFDKHYVDKILQINKSRSAADPNKRIKDFFRRGYFGSSVKQREKEDLNALISNKRTQANIAHPYFFHSFRVLFSIYLKLWAHATKSDNLLIQVTHDLLFYSRKYKIYDFVVFSFRFLQDFYMDFGRGQATDFLKANHLLTFREFNKLLKKSKNKERKLLKAGVCENEFIASLDDDEKDPIYKVLLALYNNDIDLSVQELSKCRNLDKRDKEWFLFLDMRKHPKFEKAFSKAIS